MLNELNEATISENIGLYHKSAVKNALLELIKDVFHAPR
jgi:hypothetical protein